VPRERWPSWQSNAHSCLQGDITKHPVLPLQHEAEPPCASELALWSYLPSKVSVRSFNLLIKPSAPPEAMMEANSSRRVARSLIVPLR